MLTRIINGSYFEFVIVNSFIIYVGLPIYWHDQLKQINTPNIKHGNKKSSLGKVYI